MWLLALSCLVLLYLVYEKETYTSDLWNFHRMKWVSCVMQSSFKTMRHCVKITNCIFFQLHAKYICNVVLWDHLVWSIWLACHLRLILIKWFNMNITFYQWNPIVRWDNLAMLLSPIWYFLYICKTFCIESGSCLFWKFICFTCVFWKWPQVTHLQQTRKRYRYIFKHFNEY